MLILSGFIANGKREDVSNRVSICGCTNWPMEKRDLWSVDFARHPRSAGRCYSGSRAWKLHMHSFMCSASRSCFVLIMNIDTDLESASSQNNVVAWAAKLLIYCGDAVVVAVVLINIFEEHEWTFYNCWYARTFDYYHYMDTFFFSCVVSRITTIYEPLLTCYLRWMW